VDSAYPLRVESILSRGPVRRRDGHTERKLLEGRKQRLGIGRNKMTDATPPLSKPDAGSSQPTHDETDRLYRFRRLELTRLGAADLIKEVLASSRDPLKRNAIAEEVQRLHVARGGKRTWNLVMRVKKALRGFRELGEVEQPVPGYYSRANPDQQQLEMDDEEPNEGNEVKLPRFRGHSIVGAIAPGEVHDGTEEGTLPAGVPGRSRTARPGGREIDRSSRQGSGHRRSVTPELGQAVRP
jgi:hypothetical protein